MAFPGVEQDGIDGQIEKYRALANQNGEVVRVDEMNNVRSAAFLIVEKPLGKKVREVIIDKSGAVTQIRP